LPGMTANLRIETAARNGVVRACIFWLKNRQHENWRDKVDPGLAATRFNFIGMLPSEEEWIKQYGSHSEPLVINQSSEAME
jgi:hypothetical protein